MDNKIIQFLSKFWETTISPTIKAFAENSNRNTEKIVKTFQGKEYPKSTEIENPSEISDPIVEAQRDTIEAILAIPKVEIPEIDLKPLEVQIEALKASLEAKEMIVNVGKTNIEVDTKSVVKAIEKLEKNLPKMEKQEVIDYTMMFSEMMDIMEKPKDHSEMIKLQELIKKLGTSADLSVIADWLMVIAKKESPEFPEFKKDADGRILVKVDRVGGGGGGLTQDESLSLQAIAGFNIPAFDHTTATVVDSTHEDIKFYKDSILVGTLRNTFSDSTWTYIIDTIKI